MRIGALARLAGVPVKTIRYYADLGLLASVGRTRGRYRLFGAADRLRLEQIRILRELGFGLDAIARLLGPARARAGHAISPRAVVEAQLAAIERERRHLGRAAAVLRAALAGGASDPASATLRVGAVLRLAAWQRAGVLREQVAGPLRTTSVDPRFLERLLDAAFGDIPEELDDAQWDAFVELVALITDPSFGASLAAQSEPFWQRAQGFDVDAWQRDLGALLRRGVAVLAASAGPDQVEAQQLADIYLRMVARATGRQPGRALIGWILDRVDAHDPRAERFWVLVAAVHRRPPAPHGAVMRLVHAALRSRLAALTAGAGQVARPSKKPARPVRAARPAARPVARPAARSTRRTRR